MSNSTITQRKSSPCCIGCVVLLILAIGLSLAGGIYMYRFAKKNLSFPKVASKIDPPLDIAPSELLPPTAGDFKRTSLLDTLENVPEWHDMTTTGAHVAVYQDPVGHQMTVIAVSTKAARDQRESGTGLLTIGRPTANVSDTAVMIKDSFTGPGTRVITTWSKSNWTFMLQTTSTLTEQFLKDFHPGGVADTTGTLTSGSSEVAPTDATTTAAQVEEAPAAKPANTPTTPQGQASLAAEAMAADDAVTTGL